MKVIFNCHVPFLLAHGGAQIQIEQTKAALEQIGLTVEPLRWWDEQQSGDVLHHFGRIPAHLLKLAQQKGMKVVIAELLTEQGSRPLGRLRLQRAIRAALEAVAPASALASFGWESYHCADACLANTAWEAHLMHYLYGAPRHRIHVIPNGVEDVFFKSPVRERGPWLVCTATITQRKRVLELAEAAVEARTPLQVIGKPYGADDPYAARFLALAKAAPALVRYEGAISDRAELARRYREARGFVLLSTMETRSLSAEEAAACACPLLLSDLPWARDVFKDKATYCPVDAPKKAWAEALRHFYDRAPQLEPPALPLSWVDVARQLQGIYQSLQVQAR
jgi:glycosyltransferase involved in cell wall biosynthesis